MCLAQGHTAVPLVRLKSATDLQSPVKHSTTVPFHSHQEWTIALSGMVNVLKLHTLVARQTAQTQIRLLLKKQSDH